MITAYLYCALSFLQDRFDDRKDRGATAVEYGLLVGLIAVVIIAVVATLGTHLSTLFGNVSNSIPTTTTPPAA